MKLPSPFWLSRLVRRRRRSTRSEARGSVAGKWRVAPLQLSDVWARSAVIHFSQSEPWPLRKMWRVAGELKRLGRSLARAGQIGHSGEFAGFRAYQSGDDLRLIDWRATARRGLPVVRQWEGESQSDVVILVDVSASAYVEGFADGPKPIRPVDLSFEVATIIAAAALSQQMSVTVVLTSDRVELELKRLKGRDKLALIVKTLSEFTPEGKKTNWESATPALKQIPSASWMFLLSDFHWLPNPESAFGYFRRFRSFGLKIAANARELLGDSDAELVDVESGQSLSSLFTYASMSQTERLDEWSRLSGVPVLNMSHQIQTPEKLLADWLRGAYAP